MEIFWKIIERISIGVTILGLSGIAFQMCNFHRELSETKVNEKIIDAVVTFNAASDTADYKKAFDKFLTINKDFKSSDTTGFSLFLALAKRIKANIKEQNDGFNKYDKEVETYLQYAKVLNEIEPNEATILLIALKELKDYEK